MTMQDEESGRHSPNLHLELDDDLAANGNGSGYDGTANGTSSGSISRGTGKSGRVIEKLMAENDRLRRELRSETAKREEEARRGEVARSARDSLQSINENLIHQTTIDKTSLHRKERKIEELKSEKDEDKTKRAEAEQNLKKYVAETDTSLQSLKTLLSTETTERERSHRQYETLQASWKHLEEGYRTGLNRVKKSIEELHEERKKDKLSVQKLEVIVEQQRQEIEKMRVAKKVITTTYEERIRLCDEELAKIRELAETDSGQTGAALEEARKVAGELKHLLNVRKNLRVDDE